MYQNCFMRKLLLFALISQLLTFTVNSQTATNKDKDFGVGYGFHQYMESTTTNIHLVLQNLKNK